MLQQHKNTIQIKTKRLNSSTLDIYIDLKGYTLKQLDYEFIKNIIKIFQETYPNNLRIIYIKNYNFMVKTVYSIIKIFIDKETRKKIFFVKKK